MPENAISLYFISISVTPVTQDNFFEMQIIVDWPSYSIDIYSRLCWFRHQNMERKKHQDPFFHLVCFRDLYFSLSFIFYHNFKESFLISRILPLMGISHIFHMSSFHHLMLRTINNCLVGSPDRPNNSTFEHLAQQPRHPSLEIFCGNYWYRNVATIVG